MRTPLFVLLLLLTSLSCASMMIGTKPWFDEHRAGRATLAQRAAFDLGCQAEQLQFTCLGPNSNCNTVGASGCEKKATYVFTGSEWVMNSTRQ